MDYRKEIQTIQLFAAKQMIDSFDNDVVGKEFYEGIMLLSDAIKTLENAANGCPCKDGK